MEAGGSKAQSHPQLHRELGLQETPPQIRKSKKREMEMEEGEEEKEEDLVGPLVGRNINSLKLLQ